VKTEPNGGRLDSYKNHRSVEIAPNDPRGLIALKRTTEYATELSSFGKIMTVGCSHGIERKHVVAIADRGCRLIV
jgi:hypothetical protein